MIQPERVADNVYSFQSNLYAQVNAGVVAGPDMAVVIDTLAFPEETIEMRNFIEQELRIPVRYLINTHYHADHAWGNCLFPKAKIISHTLCYDLLKEKGIPSLEKAKQDNNIFRNINIVLPQITFDQGEIGLQVGKKMLKMFPLPGHSFDNIAVLVEEDRVLFSGDTFMPIPYIVDGDAEDTTESMRSVVKMGLENIVQGHGDIILRGEIEQVVKNNLDYLGELKKVVRKANRRKFPLDMLEEVSVEECGKRRVLLGGLAEQLHQKNLEALYTQVFGEKPIGSEEYFED
jgi:cyclase